MNINQTTTGCGPCPYLYNGECLWTIKCSHTLTYTTNNTDNITRVSPLPFLDPNYVYINKVVKTDSNEFVYTPTETEINYEKLFQSYLKDLSKESKKDLKQEAILAMEDYFKLLSEDQLKHHSRILALAYLALRREEF